MAKQPRPVDPVDESFEYPRVWEEEYCSTRSVAKWRRDFPDQFHEATWGNSHGTLRCFVQYALQYILRRDRRIRSVTWLYLAAIDIEARGRVEAGERWAPAAPKASINKHRTTENWHTMRMRMGSGTFDALQEAIVRGGFDGYCGEPDLFCYGPDGTWFFAEAKAARDRLLATQVKWFDIAKKVLGADHRVRLYKVVPNSN